MHHLQLVTPSYYYYYHYYFRVLADGLSLETEWEQISASPQYTSQYSSRSQPCCSLDCLHSSSYFQVLLSLNQSFGDCTKSNVYNWYNRHFDVLQFFQFSCKVEVFIPLFIFFQFYSMVSWDSKVHNFESSFLSWLLKGLVVWLWLVDLFLC